MSVFIRVGGQFKVILSLNKRIYFELHVPYSMFYFIQRQIKRFRCALDAAPDVTNLAALCPLLIQ